MRAAYRGPLNLDVRRVLRVMCCFCGRGVENEPPLEIVLKLPGDTTQTMYAHGDCFGKLLDPSVNYMPPRDYLDDQ